MKKNLDSIVAAIAGFTIIILYTRHGGIGISPDSTVYMSAAENLHNNGHLSEFTGNPVVNFPFFYPFFLNILMWLTGLKPVAFAPYVNAFLFAALIYFSGTIMERFNHKSKWYKAAILSCIVLSPGLLEDYSMLWSETVFILLLLLFINAMNRYLQQDSMRSLLIAAVLASFASITRYAGVTIIATGGILILLNAGVSFKKRVKDIFLFFLISSFLLVVNLTMNYIASGTLTGGRERSITSLYQNIRDTGNVFSDWLPFLSGHYSVAVILAILIIVGLMVICVKKLLQDKRITGHPYISATFSLIYILFMITMASIVRQEGLNSRFLTPAFIPLLWSGSSWIVSSYQISKGSIKKFLLISSIIIFLCFQYNQLKADAENWDGIKDAGIPGYTEDPWKYSETVQFTQKNILFFSKDFTIYSDAPGAIYFFTGKPGMSLPHKDSGKEIQLFLNNKKCYVVWFNDGTDADVVDESFIAGIKKMNLLKSFSDGAIYVSGK